MPSNKPQIKVRLSPETKEKMRALCELYEMTASNLVSHLVRSAARKEKVVANAS